MRVHRIWHAMRVWTIVVIVSRLVVIITIVVIVTTTSIIVIVVIIATTTACNVAASHKVRIGALGVNIPHLRTRVIIIIVVIITSSRVIVIVVGVVGIDAVVIGGRRFCVSLLSDTSGITLFGTTNVTLLIAQSGQTGTAGLVAQRSIGVCRGSTSCSIGTINIDYTAVSIVVLNITVHLTARCAHTTVVPTFPVVFRTRRVIAPSASSIRDAGLTKDAGSGFIVSFFFVLHALRVLAAGVALGGGSVRACWLSLHDLHFPGSIGIRVGG